MESLGVALGSRSYPIHIGVGLIGSAQLYAPYLKGGGAAIVTNEVVAPLYLAKVKQALSGARVAEIVVPDGEQAKGMCLLHQRVCRERTFEVFPIGFHRLHHSSTRNRRS